MEIHGKKLEITNDRTGIYYDNIKITDTISGLNEYNSFDDWVKIITENKDFEPRKYHPNLFKNI